ncbi:MAG: acyl-CoA thioesterase [Deltaproteobacteria bacterium]|nr:acyl-CoA thioesterase [Deltaproteobacteria bacterium]
MSSFIRSYKIRFEDCDMAGIVFYPQYVLMLHRIVEDWFAEALDMPMSIMHRQHKIGFPTVNLKVDFRKASRLDEVLEWSLEVRRLKTRSATLGICACYRDERRLEAEITIVSVDLVDGDISSREIPHGIRAGMEAYLYA